MRSPYLLRMFAATLIATSNAGYFLGAACVSVPNTPAASLDSRRGRDFAGRAAVFAVNEETTVPSFVETIRAAQHDIQNVLREDSSPLMFDTVLALSKSERQRLKFWKDHKYLHLAFFSSVIHGPIEEYAKKEAEVKDLFEEEEKILQAFFDQGVTARCKECKLNPDGHLVVRMFIEPQERYLECKTALNRLFGRTVLEERHVAKVTAEPNVLAMVIGVLDPERLRHPEAKTAIQERVKKLEADLKDLGVIPLHSIANIHYDKRTLSPKSQINKTCLWNIDFLRKQTFEEAMELTPVVPDRRC